MRVVGIDPGTIVWGWAVIDCDAGSMVRVASGSISLGRGELSGRLGGLYRELAILLERHAPEFMSLERSFVARNVQSAFRLGEARGVTMAAAAAAGVAVREYSPATIKKAVAGHGRADKAQIQAAVVRIFGLDGIPAEDEADALAAAACHGFSHRFLGRVEQAVARVPGPALAGRGRRR